MNTTTQQPIYLQGHTCKENAYEVKDYPYGFRLKTSIFYWIETKKGKGDRFCSYTINPKTGRPNAPKCSTYSTFMYMYLNEQGYVTHGVIDAYDHDEFEARFEFILNKLDMLYITSDQQSNIRVNLYQHILGNAPYQLVKYSEAHKPLFKAWLSNTVKHIKTSEFKDLLSCFPDMPVFDMPENEIGITITQYNY